MPGAISVPAGFADEFAELCTRMRLDARERNQLRDQVRADFDTVGAWVRETVAVYRFCDRVWGYVPPASYCEGYLAARGWWPEDESIFQRYGPLLLAKICAQVDGVIPWPATE